MLGVTYFSIIKQDGPNIFYFLINNTVYKYFEYEGMSTEHIRNYSQHQTVRQTKLATDW